MRGMLNWFWIVEEQGFAVIYNQKQSKFLGVQAIYSKELDRGGMEEAQKFLAFRLRQQGGTPLEVEPPSLVLENARKARVAVPATVFQVMSER